MQIHYHNYLSCDKIKNWFVAKSNADKVLNGGILYAKFD